MSRNFRSSTSRIVASIISLIALQTFAQTPPREVAITFDDLPIAGVLPRDDTSARELTTKLLRAIGEHTVPVVGFVNEDKLLARDGSQNPERVALLRRWLDGGLELGNHGFSHRDLHETPLDVFEADVLKGESVIRALMNERAKTLRFFRHPFLHTGRDLDTRERVERFLAGHGYRVAPVTIDNDEYVFAAAYDRASVRGSADVMRQVSADYVPYMQAKFAFFERNAQELFGRDIRHILLLHANMLNADRFADLAAMLERRGYRFITLDRALEDPAYQSPDRFIGTGGITWLHRWVLTKGLPKTFFAGEPDVPRYVADNARP
jgi:peptidoglycan/xylan/chitin deacetylase (PgdA/CDA1 family)